MRAKHFVKQRGVSGHSFKPTSQRIDELRVLDSCTEMPRPQNLCTAMSQCGIAQVPGSFTIATAALFLGARSGIAPGSSGLAVANLNCEMPSLHPTLPNVCGMLFPTRRATLCSRAGTGALAKRDLSTRAAGTAKALPNTGEEGHELRLPGLRRRIFQVRDALRLCFPGAKGK